MKISVLINSRGRPRQLANAISSLKARESGRHQVAYVIGCDGDDPDTIAVASKFATARVFPQRLGSLGAMINVMAEENPADVYIAFVDDAEVRSRWWDEEIYQLGFLPHPDRVFFWESQNKCIFAVVTEKWRAAAGRIFTGYFPYWFDDGWLMQVGQYAMGMNSWLRFETEVFDSCGKTHRMHDYPVWDEFFWERDCERLEEAARIARRLGWPAVDNPQQYKLEKILTFTQEQIDGRSEGGPRTPEYLAALANAQAILARRGATLRTA